MFGPRQPLITNNAPWNYHRMLNSESRPYFGPRAQYQGYRQRFNLDHNRLQPGNENYWCETCDRGFLTEDILNKHKAQHQKCNIDGCQFIAHPKVITKHIQMQHSSGLYKKISNIHKPEDIEKWREERRKRYPTKANIDKKTALLQEKIKRGEKMGLDHSKSNFNKCKQDHSMKRTSNIGNENQPRAKFNRNTHSDAIKKPRSSKKPLKPIPLFEDDRKLKPFSGILSLEMISDNETEEPSELSQLIEDDLEESVSNVNIPSEPVVCGALSSLICDYGSSDEESTVEITNKNTTSMEKPAMVINNDMKKHSAFDGDNKNVESIIQVNHSVDTDIIKCVSKRDEVEVCNEANVNCEDDNSGPEEVKVIKVEDITPALSAPTKRHPIQTNIRKTTGIGRKHPFKTSKPKMPSTLLHKLLFREMQQERNIVLQCIRHVIKANYFDKQE